MNRALACVLFASVMTSGAAAVTACATSKTPFDDDAGGVGPENEAGVFNPDSGSAADVVEASTTVTTTVYANTDDTLYSMDPATMKVSLIGPFAGMGGTPDDTNVTDCAVDADGVVWVNTTTVVYKAALPAGGTGTVNLTKVATIAVKANQRFYALGFVPAGVLDTGETLVAGDGNGELWSIDTATGDTIDLGGFGKDKTRFFALSGDVVFYKDKTGKPTGLATVRSCLAGGTSCTTTNDYLAGIDMVALANAYKSGAPASSLLSGIYGGSSSSKGSGVGTGSFYGLGAWQGSVFGFSRGGGAGKSASLYDIDTGSGAGKFISSLSFTNGWSGAGVTTKVTINVPPPPPPPN